MTGRAVLTLVIISSVALGLRSAGLSWGLPNTSHHFSYHPDEYNVVRALAAMRPESLDLNPRYFHNPALYYYVCGAAHYLAVNLGLAPPLRADDFHERPDRVARLYLTGRLLSVAFAVATIVVVFVVGVQLSGVAGGALAATLVALSPAHIVISQYMDVDALLGLWAATVLLATTRAVATGSTSMMVLAAAATGLATGTKYNGIILLAPCLVAALSCRRRRRLHVILTMALPPLCFLLAAPYTLLDFDGFRSGIDYVLRERVAGRWSGLGHSLAFPLVRTWPWLVGELGLLLATAGLAFGMRSHRSLVMPCLVLVVTTYASVAVTGADYVRYSTMALPGLAVGAGMVTVVASTRRARRSIAVIAVISIATVSVRSLAVVALQRPDDVRDQASEWLLRELAPGSVVLVPREPYFFSPPRLFMDYFYSGASASWRSPDRYFQVLNANWDADALANPQVDAVVLSEHELHYPTAPDGATSRFLTALTSSTDYREVARFDRPARLGPLALEPALPPPGWIYQPDDASSLRDRRLPHDLKYLNPAVIVFVRSSR